jgi:hypothetical protein
MLLFVYIGVISENKLNSSIMKKIVLALALAVTGVINAQLEYYEYGVYIDTTAEKGSFDNPYIVDSVLASDPYVWFYIDNNQRTSMGKGMYGLKEDMIEYAYNTASEFGENAYEEPSYRDVDCRKEWDIIDDDETHYLMILLNFEETSHLYVHQLSHQEHIDQIKHLKKHYIHIFGKEKVDKWLGKN